MSDIRYASERDIGLIVELAAREHALSSWSHQPFDAAAAAQTVEGFIRSHGRTLLMSDGGYLMGLVQPMGFSRRLMAMEYAWFSEDGRGMALLGRFERWARNMGAVELIAHNYANDQRMTRLMSLRRGYRTIGTAMSLRLEN